MDKNWADVHYGAPIDSSYTRHWQHPDSSTTNPYSLRATAMNKETGCLTGGAVVQRSLENVARHPTKNRCRLLQCRSVSVRDTPVARSTRCFSVVDEAETVVAGTADGRRN